MTLSPPPDQLIGRVFDNRYEVTGLLGTGGMAAVYRAVHNRLDKVVALKIMSESVGLDEKQVRRFTQEAKACSKLQHPNIIRVFDHGQSPDGLLYIVMELLEGQPLSETMANDGPLDQPRGCRIMRQVCHALGEAHNVGIIHRDLKPDNIFMSDVPGHSDFVKLLDFGIAKVMGDGNQETLTQTGYICGTPLYISPEQSLGKKLDGGTDLYAVGIMLYEFFTGRTPFTADTAIALVMKHIHEPVPPMRAMNPDVRITPELEEYIYQLLDKDPANRPQSAVAVARQMERFAAVPVPSSSGTAMISVPEVDATQALPTSEADATLALEQLTAEQLNSADPTQLLDVSELSAEQMKTVAHDVSALSEEATVVGIDASVVAAAIAHVDGETIPDVKNNGRDTNTLAIESRLIDPKPKKRAGWHWLVAAAFVIGAVALVLVKPDWLGLSSDSTSPPTAEDTEKTPSSNSDSEIASSETSTHTSSSGTADAPPNSDTNNKGGDGTQPVVTMNTAANQRQLDTDTDRRERRVIESKFLAAAPGDEGLPSAAPRVFKIESVPSGAQVFIRGKMMGVTPYNFRIDARTQESTVIVMKTGHIPETWSYSPTMVPPAGQNKVKLVLRPSATVGTAPKDLPAKKKKKKKKRRKKRITWEE